GGPIGGTVVTLKWSPAWPDVCPEGPLLGFGRGQGVGRPNETSSRAPPRGSLAASACPPCASTAWRTMASPSPDPGWRRASSARAVQGALDDLVERHVVGHGRSTGSARQLDHIRDERGEAVELLDDVRPQALPVLRRQPVGLLERLDVRAQRGDRGAQLV